MAEQVGEVLADAAGDVVVVGLADTAGEDLDECFALAGVGHVDGGDGDGRVLGEGYDSLNLVHGAPLLGAVEPQPLDKGFLIRSHSKS